MSYELPKTYDFKSTEQRIYAMWEAGGYFQPHNDPNQPNFDPSVKPFVITIPPPNVTGELHLGHAMFVSVEDLMVRYHRMKGYSTLWVPGTDHAGIATQLMVERQLAKEGSSREQIGREKFLERTWEWKRKYAGHITSQIRRLGASCDWTRERFTLDEGLSKAVREAFVRLYEKGLVYRGPRLINWSPGLKTAVSDLEVEYSEEPGTLYYFKYMLANSEDFIPVATTRPETILGDTAVAVHPEDERYQKFIGKKVIVPMLGREIPVIADEYVAREFGTGALKITPGHDPNDYEIGQRHGLPVLSMLDKSARVTEIGGPYQGLERFEARKKLWADMKAAGLVIKEEPYTLNVPRSQRGGEIIEPMISEQWFVKIAPLAQKALAAVKNGQTKIVPEHFEKVYYNWLENIQDWCISRQLWWGHRIPVWYCADCGQQTCTREDPSACAHCGSANIEQDPDVLDTWFSSGLWPFSTLGWPEETPDLKYFYPTSYMETGYDILFFWVARMIMTGLLFTNDIPFHTVYLHGLVRDEVGRKMSKTYNNVIDPIAVMDEFGADALRFTLLTGSTPGNDMNLSLDRIRANRNFANKIWNAARFTVTNLGKLAGDGQRSAATGDQSSEDTGRWSLADCWIMSRLHATVAEVTRLFDAFQYGEAGRQAYEFLWGDFADWYIEIAKTQLAQGGATAWRTAAILVHVLDQTLRLLHPFIPFVTEDIWQNLKRAAQAVGMTPAAALSELGFGGVLPTASTEPAGQWPEALIIAPWPQAGAVDGAAEVAFGRIQEAVRAIRNARNEYNVAPGRRIGALISAGEHLALFQEELAVITSLAMLDAEHVQLGASLAMPPKSVALVAGGATIGLPLVDLVDMDAEIARLQKELANADKMVRSAAGRLANPGFVNSAPPHVVEGARQQLAEWESKKAQIEQRLAALAS